MSNNKKIWILLIFTGTIFFSCDKEEDPTITLPEQIEVRFSTFLKSPFHGTTTNKGDIPTCENSHASPHLLYVRIDGENHILALNNNGDKSKDYVLLTANEPHYLQEFVVLDITGEPIWAAPHSGGPFQDYIDVEQRLSREFLVLSGQKTILTQQVLCFTPTRVF